jgi:alkane 1-monooxygenase
MIRMLKLSPIPYYAVLILPTLVFLSAAYQEYFLYLPLAYIFIVVPLMDQIIGIDTTNLTPEEETRIKNSSLFSLPYFIYVIFQVLLFLYLIYQLSAQAYGPYEFLWMAINFGLTAGAAGVTIGHELSHRKHKLEKIAGSTLMASINYLL